MTVQEAIEKGSSRIARRDAELLLLHVVGRDRAWLLAHPEARLEPGQIAGFFSMVERRAQHWPVQYLTGKQEFFGIELEISADVLIPRPETELLVEAVLAWAGQRAEAAGEEATGLHVVDVGTGSGAIAVALAKSLRQAWVAAVDISPPVQTVVGLNASRAVVADRVRYFESDLLSVFAADVQGGRRFDVIVSNPPYVPLGDAATLQPEVRDFEPHLALFAGEDGLAVYRRLIPQAWEALRPGGLLAMEFGFGQSEALASLLQPWNGVRFRDDYAGIPRIVVAERP